MSCCPYVWQIVGHHVPNGNGADKIEFQDIRYCRAPDGTALAYATVGQGLPLLKAAHFMAHLEHEWNSPAYGTLYQELAKRFKFIRYDQRGNGLSDRDPENINFDLHVQDFETVADSTGLDRFSVIGASQGAPIAITYAVRHPERVSALVIHGGYTSGRLVRDYLTDDDRAKVEALSTLIRTGWGQDNPAFRHMFTSMFIPGGTTEDMDSFDELMRVAAEPEVAAKIFEANCYFDVSDILHLVKVPTLIIHSRQDLVSPFEEARRLAAAIPNARLVELDTPNHILLHNEPAMVRFIAEVTRFLEEPTR